VNGSILLENGEIDRHSFIYLTLCNTFISWNIRKTLYAIKILNSLSLRLNPVWLNLSGRQLLHVPFNTSLMLFQTKVLKKSPSLEFFYQFSVPAADI